MSNKYSRGVQRAVVICCICFYDIAVQWLWFEFINRRTSTLCAAGSRFYLWIFVYYINNILVCFWWCRNTAWSDDLYLLCFTIAFADGTRKLALARATESIVFGNITNPAHMSFVYVFAVLKTLYCSIFWKSENVRHHV